MKKIFSRILNSRFWLPLLLIILFLANRIATDHHARIDLTNEKRFTISRSTKKILKKLPEPIEVKVLLKGDYPSGFRNLASASEDILKEFRELSDGRLQYDVISPDETVEESETSYADTLRAMGYDPMPLVSQLKEGQQQLYVFPLAVVHYGGRMLPVTLYKAKSPFINQADLFSAVALLEYNLAEGIALISDSARPVIGYLTGHDEPLPGEYKVYDLLENVLNPSYQTFSYNLNARPAIPEEFDLMIMVKPEKVFDDAAKLKLDQYLMKGGKLLIFLDRLEAEMDSLQIKNQVIAYDRGLELNDLLFRYGVRVNPNLIMDLQCDYLPFDLSGAGQYEFLPWNYFPVLETPGDHAITRNLGFVSGRFVNSMDTVEAEGIKKTILLHSSVNSRIIGSPALISGAENVNAPEDQKFNKQNIPAAVLLEGNFRSLFDNRLTQSLRDSLSAAGESFLSRSVNKPGLIVAADGDLVMNSLYRGSEPLPMGLNPYTYGTQREFNFANRDFLMNCINYLVDEFGLSEARSRDHVVRLLDNKKAASEKSFWQLFNILAPVVLIIIFGYLFNSLRKYRFALKK